LGIIYPAGLSLPLRLFPSESPAIFSKISQRMGMSAMDAINKLSFGAGTMFIARANALLLLANVALPKSSFEDENTMSGIITLAHVIERAIAVSVHQSGLQFREMDEPTCSRKDFDYFHVLMKKMKWGVFQYLQGGPNK
jgi:lipopolysaccharide biosynthesis protein